jgi:hypothetical protein
MGNDLIPSLDAELVLLSARLPALFLADPKASERFFSLDPNTNRPQVRYTRGTRHERAPEVLSFQMEGLVGAVGSNIRDIH